VSETNANEPEPASEEELGEQRDEMGQVQERLDAESDEEGLGAEAGRAEENGISQG
jgi:hypothetical protein